ncbi:hypothetical protein [Corticibacter populi]|nr:hypothetical protein [Corticibacter populi]RZS31722.1 hypothetical protein EV687_2392 [Corticibacter populi]
MTIESIDFAQLSVEQIKHFIAQAQLALTDRKDNTAPRRVAIAFDSYNGRRYSRPWIARVTAWPVGGKPTLDWGNYVGSDSGGEAEVNAKPGDIIRWGQKDGRGNGTRAYWGVVAEDGSVDRVTEVQARNAFSA